MKPPRVETGQRWRAPCGIEVMVVRVNVVAYFHNNTGSDTRTMLTSPLWVFIAAGGVEN